MEEKLSKLLEDSAFLEKIRNAETFEKMSELLENYGIQVTPEEIKSAIVLPDGELNENDLDGVAGGWSRGRMVAFLRALAEMLKI